MDSALAVRLKKLFLRTVLYALGLAAVAALLLGAVFMLAKPKLLSLAQSEMRKYGIEARQTDMSLLGYVKMRDLSIPLHQGGMVRLESLSVRPPLYFFGHTWLGGAGALYNLRVEKGAWRAFIPKLSFSGAALEEKDSAIASRSLQMLMRLRLGSLYAGKIELSSAAEKTGAENEAAGNKAALQAVIDGFGMSGLRAGKIAAISYSGVDSNVSLPAEQAAGANAKSKISHMRSGAFLARNVDAVSLYALARNIAPSGESGAAAQIPFPQGARDLAGAVRLYNLDISAEDAKLGTVHIAADELGSRGFSLKGGKTAADFILQLPAEAEAGAAGAAEAKKKIISHNMRGLLADMASVDMNAQNLALEVEPRPEILAAAEAARQAAAAQAAADKNKTVRDILDEEQERAEQRQGSENGAGGASVPANGLKRELAHFPLQFKLAVSSFALRANHWEQALPHNIYLKVKNFTFIPGKNSNELLQALHDMGHEDLQFSMLGDMAWNPQNSELNMKQLAFYGRDMGGFSLKGTMLDVPPSLFDGKAEAVSEVLNEAGIGDMEIKLEDSGFIHNLVQWGTTQINISAHELQTDLHDIAVKSPPLLLKNRKEAQNFSAVFGSFVNDSGTIRIKMSAPQAGGLKLHDIMASQDNLSVLLDKLRLSADRPEQEPLIE